jgi:TldD protein
MRYPTMTRRKFMGAAAAGATVLTVPGFFRSGGVAYAAVTPGDDPFFDVFGLDQALMGRLMGRAMSRGGDFADLFFQHKLATWIGLEDGDVNRAYGQVDLGVGIRVVVGDQTGYAFTEDLTEEAMLRAADTAAGIATAAAGPVPEVFVRGNVADHYAIELPWSEVGADRKIPLLTRLEERCFELDERMEKIGVWYADEESRILVVRSDGAMYADYQPMTRLGVSCTAQAGDERQSNGANLSARVGFEFYDDDRLERLANRAVDRTTVLFDAVRPPAGEFPVVLDAGSSGILLHEAIGHGMEADFNRKEISIFSDMIGKKVAEPFVTIVDDGTNPNVRGSLNIDDEGNPVENTVLVQDGIMRSYLHDRISATHYGVEPTGNGRRQSFRYSPLPRMRNTYMLPGPHTRDEIIASVDFGILAETFTNGQVQIGAGDFTFYIKTGYLIEGGKLTSPIKDVNIIGNGPDVLSKVAMVGDDTRLSRGGWTCGKGGQGVPVGQGLPTTLVSSITVGGVNA